MIELLHVFYHWYDTAHVWSDPYCVERHDHKTDICRLIKKRKKCRKTKVSKTNL